MKKIKKVLLYSLAIMALISSCQRTDGNSKHTSSSVEDEESLYEQTKDYLKNISVSSCFLSNCSSNGTTVFSMDSSSSYVKFSVDVPVATYYEFSLMYKCDNLTKYHLYVNEFDKYSLNFEGNGTNKATRILVKLNKGSNTFKIRNNQGQGYNADLSSFRVAGIKNVSTAALFIEDQIVYEHEEKIEFKRPVGFDFKIVNSSDLTIIDLDGNLLNFSANRSVVLDLSVSREEKQTTKQVNVLVRKGIPSAEEIANEIFISENNKELEKAKTSMNFPKPYDDIEVFMVYSSDELLMNRNGVVNAIKDDSTVKVKYLIRKLDGTEATTEEITYKIPGLGFDYDSYFENPLGVGQDPFSTFIDGYYYHIRSVNFADFARLEMIKSESLVDYKNEGFTTIWTTPEKGTNSWNSLELWGPFPLMKWSDGYYYIYYAADNGNNYNHRQGVLKSKEKTPLCEYEDLGIVNTSDLEDNPNPTVGNTVWAIGATTYQDTDGSWYLTWSGWKNNNDGFPQRSYIAKIIEPNRIGARKEISQPTEEWEGVTHNSPIQEGQAIFRINGHVFLVYSADSSWAGRYSLGVLTYENKYEGGLLNAKNWTKLSEPVFVTTEYVESPGGPSIIQSPDGNEYWLLYHCSTWKGSGWTRVVCAKPIRLNEDTNIPVFDDPLPLYSLCRKPSGDHSSDSLWTMFEAENCEMHGNLTKDLSNLAHGGEYIKNFKGEDDYISLKYEVETTGFYTVRVGYFALTEGTNHVLQCNKKYYNVLYDYKGENTLVVKELSCLLSQGENIINLSYVSGYDVYVDFIGIKKNS